MPGGVVARTRKRIWLSCSRTLSIAAVKPGNCAPAGNGGPIRRPGSTSIPASANSRSSLGEPFGAPVPARPDDALHAPTSSPASGRCRSSRRRASQRAQGCSRWSRATPRSRAQRAQPRGSFPPRRTGQRRKGSRWRWSRVRAGQARPEGATREGRSPRRQGRPRRTRRSFRAIRRLTAAQERVPFRRLPRR